MTRKTSAVAFSRSSASSRSRVRRAASLSWLAVEEARRRTAFGALPRFNVAALRRRVLTDLQLVLERRLMRAPWLRTWHRSGSDQHFGRGSYGLCASAQ